MFRIQVIEYVPGTRDKEFSGELMVLTEVEVGPFTMPHLGEEVEVLVNEGVSAEAKVARVVHDFRSPAESRMSFVRALCIKVGEEESMMSVQGGQNSMTRYRSFDAENLPKHLSV